MASAFADNEFTPDQKIAWNLLQGKQNVFITGEAGSGKSFVVRAFMKEHDPKVFPVLASTGAAAVLVGGRTFHSFMGLGIMEGGAERTISRALEDKRAVKRIKKVEGIIIDEVSMLSGTTLNVAEKICQAARESAEPWGGMRVIAVGDFAQLPPVQPYGSAKRDWAFQDSVWQRSQFAAVVLKNNLRTDDKEFLNVLNYVRSGVVNDKVTEFLNSRMVFSDDEFCGTRLFPRRAQTDTYNTSELNKIPGESYVFATVYLGNDKSVEQLKRNSPLPDELELKIDALVMLRQNDPKQRYVNGSTGFIRDIQDESLTIELLNGRIVEVGVASFSLMNADGVVMASATNFPVTLAYAATIHKAQGMTLDKLVVNLSSLWEPGQAYVALSRVTNPAQLHVESWQAASIRSDRVVSAFYDRLVSQM